MARLNIHCIMPKRSPAQLTTLARARIASGSSKQEPCTPESLQGSLEECQRAQSLAQIEISELKNTLESEQAQASRDSILLIQEKAKNTELSKELARSLEKISMLRKQLHVEKQGRKRASVQKDKLTQLNNSLKVNEQALTSHMSNMSREMAGLLNMLDRKEVEKTKLQLESAKDLGLYQTELNLARQKFDIAQGKLRDEKKNVTALKKSNKQLIEQHNKSLLAQSKAKYHHLMHKGVYAESTRQLVRFLVKAGCTRDKIASVIHEVLKIANVQAVGKISQRSVSRMIIEGFFASQMQLGHEMQKANSLTLSADGTTH